MMILKRKQFSKVGVGEIFRTGMDVMNNLSNSDPKHSKGIGILGTDLKNVTNKLTSLPEYLKTLKQNDTKPLNSSEASQESLTPMLPYEYKVVLDIMSDPKTLMLTKKIKDTHEQWDNLLGVLREDAIQNSKEQYPILFALGHRYGFAYNFNNSGWFLVRYYGYSNKERPIPIGLSPKYSILDAIEELMNSEECTVEKKNLLEHQYKQVEKRL